MTTFGQAVKTTCAAKDEPPPNIDPETGIAYGVLQGNNYPYILDDIITCGEDLTFAAQREEIRDNLRAAMVGVLEDMHHDADSLISEESADFALESAENAGLWDMSDSNEHEYAYESDGVHMLLSWLGGAPLIYVVKSPHTTRTAECSPCVPCAGDLDAERTPDGVLCYDIPPDWYTGDESPHTPGYIVKTNHVGDVHPDTI